MFLLIFSDGPFTGLRSFLTCISIQLNIWEGLCRSPKFSVQTGLLSATLCQVLDASISQNSHLCLLSSRNSVGSAQAPSPHATAQRPSVSGNRRHQQRSAKLFPVSQESLHQLKSNNLRMIVSYILSGFLVVPVTPYWQEVEFLHLRSCPYTKN